MSPDQGYCCRHQIGVVPGGRAVGQHRDVLQSGTNPMASVEGAAIDGPARHAVAVVNLIQLDARGDYNVFHCGCVLDGRIEIEIQRLDENPTAAVGQSGGHKGTGVVTREQAGLDAHATGKQKLTKLDDARLSLIGGHQVGQVFPRLNEAPTLLRICDDRR